MEKSLQSLPGPYFGEFGGRWVPEALIAALDELDLAYTQAKADPAFAAELAELHRSYSGRRASSPRCRASPSTRAASA